MVKFLSILVLIFILAVFGWSVISIFHPYQSVSDFEQVRLTNYRSYMKRNRIGRTRRPRIVIEADGKEYRLISNDALIPDGMHLTDFLRILNDSTEIIL
jgi:hypothetical protein